MLNWEMEIKKWCPAFKVLVYYGSQKERKLKRVGWTKPNAFHICITSYKLVIQDHSSFMEIKKWCPAFKVLVYYGSQKERKLKRVGWTKPNAFHICITSYKLVIQD